MIVGSDALSNLIFGFNFGNSHPVEKTYENPFGFTPFQGFTAAGNGDSAKLPTLPKLPRLSRISQNEGEDSDSASDSESDSQSDSQSDSPKRLPRLPKLPRIGGKHGSKLPKLHKLPKLPKLPKVEMVEDEDGNLIIPHGYAAHLSNNDIDTIESIEDAEVKEPIAITGGKGELNISGLTIGGPGTMIGSGLILLI